MGDHFERLETGINTRFDKVGEDIVNILSELRSIRHDLEVLKDQVAGHVGYSKEIDYVMARVAMIEKHLGIQPPVMSE